MTNPNGWPGEPGVPLNPERDGYHLMREGDSFAFLEVVWWESKSKTYQDAFGRFSANHAARNYSYIGICLTPAEVEAKVAEAVKERKIGETTYDACSTRAYFPGLGYVLLSKREYEKTAKDIGEYMRGVFAEGEMKLGPKEWRTVEYEIARLNNELLKAKRRIAELEGDTQ